MLKIDKNFQPEKSSAKFTKETIVKSHTKKTTFANQYWIIYLCVFPVICSVSFQIISNNFHHSWFLTFPLHFSVLYIFQVNNRNFYLFSLSLSLSLFLSLSLPLSLSLIVFLNVCLSFSLFLSSLSLSHFTSEWLMDRVWENVEKVGISNMG